MVGYDNLIFGKNIDTCEGTDGILPADPRLNNEKGKDLKNGSDK